MLIIVETKHYYRFIFEYSYSNNDSNQQLSCHQEIKTPFHEWQVMNVLRTKPTEFCSTINKDYHMKPREKTHSHTTHFYHSHSDFHISKKIVPQILNQDPVLSSQFSQVHLAQSEQAPFSKLQINSCRVCWVSGCFWVGFGFGTQYCFVPTGKCGMLSSRKDTAQ